MHVTTIEAKLRLHLAETNATWSDPRTALWNDGEPRMLLTHEGPLTAAVLVDAHLARVPGAHLTIAHDAAPTAVARRTAERFGITLLDATLLPAPVFVDVAEAVVDVAAPAEPETVEVPLVDAIEAPIILPAPVEIPVVEREPVEAPILLPVPAPVEIPVVEPEPVEAPILLPAPATVALLPAPAVVAPQPEPAPPQELALPPTQFFARLERPVVAPAPFPEVPARFFEALHTPMVVPDFPAPPTGFFRALERAPVVHDFPALIDGLLDLNEAALEAPAQEEEEEAPAFPAPEEGFFDALDMAMVASALAAPPELDAPVEIEAPPVAMPWTMEPSMPVAVADAAPIAVEESPELPPWPAAPEGLPLPVAEAALPEPMEAEAPPAVPALPWAEPLPVADAATVDVDVTEDEVAAMPWNTTARDSELLPSLRAPPRAFTPHPTALAPQDPSWGLPWPRPIAPADGLSIVDPKVWSVRERTTQLRDGFDQKGGGSFGAVPPGAGSAWLRRLQSFGGP